MPPLFHDIERFRHIARKRKKGIRNMATGAADGLFRSLYEGCISGCDTGIERRPYHRNCRCALHDKSRGNCPHAIPKCKNVSYPIRRAWSEGCLAMAAASCHSSPSSSPVFAGAHGTGKHPLVSYKEEEEDTPTTAKL